MSDSSVNTIITAFGMLFVIANALALGMRVHIGKVLADFVRGWRLAVVVLVLNFVVLPALIIGFAAVVDIPAEIKIGYCIVALAAGAPFAPLLTRLAHGDVAMSTTLFVALVAGTVIVVPAALSPLVSIVVPSVGFIPVWQVAWPLLAFLAAPLALGCVVRLRYPRFAARTAKGLNLVSIAALLLYVNVFITAYWSLFVQAWGSGAYVAAIAVPLLGILFGSLIALRRWATRRASVITTAQRSISGAIVVTVFAYPQPLANVSVTIINTTGIVVLLVLSLEWGRRSRPVRTDREASRDTRPGPQR
jgi:BASS family bile acid:Na+ symporter